MDRFTSKLDGKGVIMLPSGVEHDWCIGTRKIGDVTIQYLSGAAADRLAAYEDSGVEPDVVKELGDHIHKSGERLLSALEHAQRLLEAEEAGRLVVLSADKARWLKAILAERERQDQKWGFPQENTYGEWGSILAEEAGELCKELNELNFGRGDPEKMETEAVQVAGVALSILEHAAVALGVTERVAKVLHRGATRPKCFYGDSDLCRGMSVNNDDEPIEACKRCWYCSAGYRQLEAETAVERGKEVSNDA